MGQRHSHSHSHGGGHGHSHSHSHSHHDGGGCAEVSSDTVAQPLEGGVVKLSSAPAKAKGGSELHVFLESATGAPLAIAVRV